MFGWLKRTFGRVSIGGERWSRSRLAGVGPTTLEQMGLEAVARGEYEGARWVLEVMIEKGVAFDRAWGVAQELAVEDPDSVGLVLGALATFDDAGDLLTAARGLRKQIDPHPALAGIYARIGSRLGPDADDARALAAITELVAAARWLAADGDADAAKMPLAVLPTVIGSRESLGPEATGLVLEAAVLADSIDLSDVVCALLERDLALDDDAQRKRACLLVGKARGRHSKGIEKLREAIEIDPDDPEAHFLLGRAFAEKAKRSANQADFDENRKQALAHLEQAREKAAARGDEPAAAAAAAGVAVAAAGGIAFLAMMAPVYDEIMYMQQPPKALAGTARDHSTMVE